MDPVEETRYTDPNTGGQKCEKLARYDLIPVDPLRQLAELYGRGSQKYAERNWELSYPWSKSYSALMRHATEFWGGEDFDQETGVPHVISVAWHAFALAHYMIYNRDQDNRPTTGPHDTNEPSYVFEPDEDVIGF